MRAAGAGVGDGVRVVAYYWCLTHQRVEQGTACPATERMGPYDTPEAARSWRDRVESRDDAWQAEDDRWNDEDEDEDDEGDGR